MKKWILAAVSGAVLLTAGAAQAGPGFNWTGFYAGAHVGGAFGNSSGSNSAVDGFNGFDAGAAETIGVDPDGVALGATLGYNWQQNQFVWGIEGEVGYISAEDSVSGAGPAADDFGSVDYGVYGSLAARLGFAQDRWLAYAKLGGAFADINEAYSDQDGTPLVIDPSDLGRDSDVKGGFLLGLGLEYAMASNWSLKLEYNFIDFSDTTTIPNGDGDIYTLENEIHIVKVGVNVPL